MKLWIIALAILASGQTFAENKTDKVDDLGAEVEAEQMEVYDQKAMDEQARQETRALDQEARSLENQMKHLRLEASTLSQRIGNEQEHYKKVAKLSRDAQVEAKKLEKQRDRLKTQLESLRARTEQSKNRLQAAEELKRGLNKELHDQNREKEQLLSKQRIADQRAKRAAQEIKKARNDQRRVGQQTSRIQQKIAGSDSRAHVSSNSGKSLGEDDL